MQWCLLRHWALVISKSSKITWIRIQARETSRLKTAKVGKIHKINEKAEEKNENPGGLRRH